MFNNLNYDGLQYNEWREREWYDVFRVDYLCFNRHIFGFRDWRFLEIHQ